MNPPLTIEDYLKYTNPAFELAVYNLMGMRTLKQLVLFAWEYQYIRSPEVAEARDILQAEHNALLTAIWQTCPGRDMWVRAECEGMWVKCAIQDGKRTITIASQPCDPAPVAFVYTLTLEK